ncbi:MAG: pyridoxamine 5'-phosphate oxidase family protein [Halobacteriota archaeon]
MVLDQETEMSSEEVGDLLGRHETGVLSLARDDEPYAIPISYGYDATEQQFYMRLVSTPQSEKRRFLSSSPQARLVVYEEDDDTYRSVVAIGTLEAVSMDELTVEHIQQYGDAKRPLFEIWADAKADLDIYLYKLEPAEMSGRLVVVDRGT